MSIGRSFGRLPDLMADDYEVKDIELVDLKSRKTAPLPDSKGLFAPRWSPDGRYIAAMQLNQSRLMLFDTIRKNLAYAVTARDSQSDLVQRFAVDLLPGIHGAGAAHLSRRARKRARRASNRAQRNAEPEYGYC